LGILHQHAPGKQLRSTLAFLLPAGSGKALVALFVTEQFGWAQCWATLTLLAGSMVGFTLPWPAARHLGVELLRPVVLVFTGIVGVVLVARAVRVYD